MNGPGRFATALPTEMPQATKGDPARPRGTAHTRSFRRPLHISAARVHDVVRVEPGDGRRELPHMSIEEGHRRGANPQHDLGAASLVGGPALGRLQQEHVVVGECVVDVKLILVPSWRHPKERNPPRARSSPIRTEQASWRADVIAVAGGEENRPVNKLPRVRRSVEPCIEKPPHAERLRRHKNKGDRAGVGQVEELVHRESYSARNRLRAVRTRGMAAHGDPRCVRQTSKPGNLGRDLQFVDDRGNVSRPVYGGNPELLAKCRVGGRVDGLGEVEANGRLGASSRAGRKALCWLERCIRRNNTNKTGSFKSPVFQF